MIKDFHVLKFQISSKDTQCFKINILALIALEQQRGVTQEVGGGEVILFCYTVHFLTFSQTKICQSKQNTLHPEIRILHLGVLTLQKFIRIALVILKIFKVVKSATFLITFDTNQT